MVMSVPVKNMYKKAWQGQTVKAAKGAKPFPPKKVEKHRIWSAAYLLIQQDAGPPFINNMINVSKA